MSLFSELGGKLKRIYGGWSLYADMAARFALTFFCLFWIRLITGGTGFLISIPLMILASAATAVLSLNFMFWPAAIMLTAAAYTKGPDLAGASAAILLVLFLLFLRFVPDELKYAFLMPLTMYFGFTPLLPIYCGLKKKPSVLFALLPGTVIFHVLAGIAEAGGQLPALDGMNFTERLKLFLNSIFTMDLAVMLIAVASCMFLTYMIRRLAIDYAFYFALLFGGGIYLLCLFFGNIGAGTEFSLFPAVISTAASAFMLFIFLLLFLPLNFKKSEQLRFEDDDYYYYVKAVPKYSSYADDEEEEEDEYEEEDDDYYYDDEDD